MKLIQSRNGRSVLAAAGLAALALMGACEGENAFQGPVGPGPREPGEDIVAPSVTITDPAAGETFLFGDTLTVTADVTDDQGLQQVVYEAFTVRGDPALGEDSVIVVFQNNSADLDGLTTDTTVARRLFPNDVDLDSATVSVVATATDAAGNTAADTVQILMGSSSVRFLEPEDGAEVFAGENPFTVEAVDPEGVREILVIVEADGAAPDTTSQLFDPAVTSTVFEGSFTIPSGVQGEAILFAVLRNVTGEIRTSDTLNLTFDSQQAVDETPPTVLFQADVAARAELTDSVRIIVESRDPTPGDGLARSAVSLWATNANADTVQVVSDTVEFTTAPRASTDTFWVALDELVEDVTTVPDTIRIRLVAWAEDQVGLCGAAVNEGEEQSLECGLSLGAVSATGRDGFSLGAVVVVSGETAGLPGGGRVADIEWDTLSTRELLIVSNLGQNLLQFVDPAVGGFLASEVLVPAPWGLSFDRVDPDILYAANSGGTNISVVDMATLTHQVQNQILTPNTVLWQVTEQLTETRISQTVEFFDFSDRPQFMALDEFNNFVYSTRPTGVSPDGTIRMVNRNLGPDPEVIFYTDYAVLADAENTTAIDRADFVSVPGVDAFGDDIVRVEDHIPGDTSTTVVGEASGTGAAPRAVENVQVQINETGQARAFSASAWDIESVGLSDTTFVAASGDGSRIALGEGNTAPTGRIMLYTPAPTANDIGTISGAVSVVDLVNNASERVFGLALSYDGELGAARGQEAAYFFDPSLRLQISVELAEGGAGIALHPLHVGGFLSTQEEVALSFVGSTDQTIRIYDTRRGSQVGEVLIRDIITGPMKATLPMSFDNAGLTCPTVAIPGTGQSAVDWTDPAADPGCVVVKIGAVTQDNQVLVVNVRVGDFDN